MSSLCWAFLAGYPGNFQLKFFVLRVLVCDIDDADSLFDSINQTETIGGRGEIELLKLCFRSLSSLAGCRAIIAL